jgi:hypothetical protein
MQGSPRLSRTAPERLDQLGALEEVLVSDAVATIEVMVAAGWPAGAAFDAYAGWLADFVAGAVDRGFCEWMGGPRP